MQFVIGVQDPHVLSISALSPLRSLIAVVAEVRLLIEYVLLIHFITCRFRPWLLSLDALELSVEPGLAVVHIIIIDLLALLAIFIISEYFGGDLSGNRRLIYCPVLQGLFDAPMAHKIIVIVRQ